MAVPTSMILDLAKVQFLAAVNTMAVELQKRISNPLNFSHWTYLFFLASPLILIKVLSVGTKTGKEVPLQVLSNLLWAAFGVNRESASFNKPGRTAPSASNSQEIDLYVALPAGIYMYDAAPHRLAPIVSGDFRRRSGRVGS